MKNFSDAYVQPGQGIGGAFLSETSHGDEPLRLQNFHDAPQVGVAGGHQRCSLGGGQLVRGAIAAGVFHEGQRAVVDDKVICEKSFRGAEALAKQAPQSAAAHLTTRAGESVNGTLGMLVLGLSNGGINADPVAHSGHFAKGHAGLRHAKGARVHAEKNDFLLSAAGQLQVLLMRGPRVIERVVDILDGLGKSERVTGSAQPACGSNEVFGGHGRAQ